MAKTAKVERKKPKQKFLDGMEPPSIPELDGLAANYFDTMQERCKLSKEEDEAKDALIDRMKSERLTRYETPDGLVVSISEKSNVKCKKKNTDDGSNAESNGDA